MSVLLRDNDVLPLPSADGFSHPTAACLQPRAHGLDSPPRSGSPDGESGTEVAAAAHLGGTVVRFPDAGRGRQGPPLPFMVARSAPMQRVLGLVEKLAAKDIPVLLAGETGTGKELLAASLHALSARASRPLIEINCAAISHQLVEAELFGHVKGAFTGAVRSREGYFGAAHRGTLVLDEVEALPLEAQAKLLRAVQHGEAQTVGTATPRHVDVRIIACTNVNLDREVNSGRFRRDLYHRLAVVSIGVPPLRERPEDIAPLVHHFASIYGKRFGVGALHVSPGLIDVLATMLWPGNVRELENTVAAMVALSEDGGLDADLLDSVMFQRGLEASHRPSHLAGLRERVDAFERGIIKRALESNRFNRSATARQLGLSRTTLLDLIRRHGLDAVAEDGPRRGEQHT